MQTDALKLHVKRHLKRYFANAFYWFGCSFSLKAPFRGIRVYNKPIKTFTYISSTLSAGWCCWRRLKVVNDTDVSQLLLLHRPPVASRRETDQTQNYECVSAHSHWLLYIYRSEISLSCWVWQHFDPQLMSVFYCCICLAGIYKSAQKRDSLSWANLPTGLI